MSENKDENSITKENELTKIRALTRSLLEKQVEKIENVEEELIEKSKKLNEKSSLLLGVGLGLLLGIIGNFTVSHWMEVLRGKIPESGWWGANVVLFIVTFIAIIVYVLWLIFKIKNIESSVKNIDEVIQDIKTFKKTTVKELKEKGWLD